MKRAMRAATMAVGVTVALALAPLAGANVSADGAGPGGELGATRSRVRIVDDRYRPRTITVERRTRVRWKNAGQDVHSVTADDRSFDSGLLSPGEVFARRFRRQGAFTYHCSVHPRMTGTIQVV